MPKVFISHSWEDNAISRQIAEYLKRDGVEIWIDYLRLKAGDNLPRRISDALEWCDTLILFWSKAAKDSYYVNLEWENALDLQKNIIPCLLDGIELPAILRRCLYADFREPEIGYQELERALNLIIKKSVPEGETISEQQLVVDLVHKISKSENKKKIISKIHLLRSEPQPLSVADVKAMLVEKNFFDSSWNKNISGFKHEYKIQTLHGDQVVLDQKSGLIWQQGGSAYLEKFKFAQDWIHALNQKGYAGYKDWRLPTLEEVMSLMEGKDINNNLYIDPVFLKEQSSIWTADPVADFEAVWAVSFWYGHCGRIDLDSSNDNNYVRAVRSIQSSQEQLPSESKRFIRPEIQIFRTKPIELAEEDVLTMLKKQDFFCFEYDWTKDFCNPNGRGFKHQYQSPTIQGDKVVIDQASGLMWQQGGSQYFINFEIAKKWIDDLNQRSYAGFKDWRLPTLEEAMSLMENAHHNGNLHIWLYIDHVFDQTQSWIWTADLVVGSAAVWVVNFNDGYCIPDRLDNPNCVRAVRSGQSSQG